MNIAKWKRAEPIGHQRQYAAIKCRYCPARATLRLAGASSPASIYVCGVCVKQLPAELRPAAPNEPEPEDCGCECAHGGGDPEPSAHEFNMWANRGADWLKGNRR